MENEQRFKPFAFLQKLLLLAHSPLFSLRRTKKLLLFFSSTFTSTTAPRSPMPHTSPTVSHVETPGLPTQTPVHGVQDMMNDRWSGMLIWSCGESDVRASVHVTDRVHDPCAHFLVEILLV